MLYALALILAAAGFGALSYFRPLWAMYAIAALLPTYLIRFSLFGLPLTWLEVMIIILFAVALWQKQIDWKKFRADCFFWPIIGVLAAATVAVFVSPDKIHALGAWKAYFVEPVLYYIVLLSLIKVRRNIEGLFWALGFSVIYIAISVAVQWVTHWGVPQAFMLPGGVGVDRSTSFYGYPNALGLYLGPIIVLYCGFLTYKNPDSLLLYFSNGARFWLKLLVIVSGLVCIWLAESEGAILAVIFCAWLMLFANKKTRAWSLIIAGISAIIIVANSGLRELVISKLTLSDYSSTIRRLIWGETWEMLKNNWFFGVGLAGYPVAIVPYHAKWFEIFPYPHNILLNVWSELGILGILAFGFVAIRYIAMNVRNIFSIVWKKAEQLPFDKVASFVFLLIGLEMIIHGLVDVPYFKNDLSVLFWIMIAASCMSVKLKK